MKKINAGKNHRNKLTVFQKHWHISKRRADEIENQPIPLSGFYKFLLIISTCFSLVLTIDLIIPANEMAASSYQLTYESGGGSVTRTYYNRNYPYYRIDSDSSKDPFLYVNGKRLKISGDAYQALKNEQVIYVSTSRILQLITQVRSANSTDFRPANISYTIALLAILMVVLLLGIPFEMIRYGSIFASPIILALVIWLLYW